MKKVAFYGRYSSANQTEQSIEGQRHVCQRYAEQNELEIVAEYVDRALSGTSDRRPQFQQMISDSEKGEWECVLVYKLDRFARDRYDSVIYKKRLRDNGVRVISATEQISDSPEGIIMEGLLEAMDEYYSAELARKMRRGIEESYRKGKYIQSIPPFGYRLNAAHQIEINPETAPIAAEIFRRYDCGQTIGEIATWLNGQGLHNMSDRRWTPMNVSRLLHKTVCKGVYRYGGIEGEMSCPAIVDAELFDRVQEKLDASATRRRKRGNYSYLLTGKMICAGCRRSVCGSTSGERHYYFCRRCENARALDADTLHRRVFDALGEYLVSEKVEELARAAYQAYSEEEQLDERPALERELKAVEVKLQNAVQAVLRGVDLDTLTDTMNNLKAQREALRASLAQAPAQMPKLTEAHFRAALTMIADKPGKELLDTIVNRVILKDDTVIICINLTDGNNDPPLEQILFRITEPPQHVILDNTYHISGWFFIAA